MVLPGYFQALKIPLLGGRSLLPEDREGSPHVLVVNQTLAEQFWPGEEALGKEIEFQFCQPVPCPVVGIVGDVKQFGLSGDDHPAMYASYLQKDAGTNYFHLALRFATNDSEAAVRALKETLWQLDDRLPLANLRLYSEWMRSNLGSLPLVSLLLSAFALLAAGLAVLGVYGVVALEAESRHYEMAIRVALGAGQGTVLKSLVGRTALMMSISLIAGIGVSLVAGRMFESLLFGVTAWDPAILIVPALVLAATAVLAAFGPATRLIRLDPARALRFD